MTMEVGFGANLCSKAGGHPRTASMEGERHEEMGGNAPRRHQQQVTARGELGGAPGDEEQQLLGGKSVSDAETRSALGGGAKQCGMLARGLDGPMDVLGRGEGGAVTKEPTAKGADAGALLWRAVRKYLMPRDMEMHHLPAAPQAAEHGHKQCRLVACMGDKCRQHQPISSQIGQSHHRHRQHRLVSPQTPAASANLNTSTGSTS